MLILKRVLQVLAVLLLISLFILPVGIIYKISQEEQAQYAAPEAISIRELSYGETAVAFRTDMMETVTISGTAISNAAGFMELNYSKPYNIRFLVTSGDVIREGELIGYYEGREIYASETGIIEQISLGESPYIQLASLEDLALECYVDASVLRILTREGVDLRTEEGVSLQVIEVGLTQSGDNLTRVLLRVDGGNLQCGQTLKDLELTTGRLYEQVLVIESRCIYHKPGDSKAYVRVVDYDGSFLREAEVTTAYSAGEYTCITGIDEGTYCDSGYKAIVEGTGDSYEGA